MVIFRVITYTHQGFRYNKKSLLLFVRIYLILHQKAGEQQK